MSEGTKQEGARIWTPTQHKYMVYLATPSEARDPLHETAWAHENGVNPATLWKWKQIPEFRAEVRRLITDSLGDNYHDVMFALKKKAAQGSFPHQKIYLEMLDVYREKSDITSGGKPLMVTEVVIKHNESLDPQG